MELGRRKDEVLFLRRKLDIAHRPVAFYHLHEPPEQAAIFFQMVGRPGDVFDAFEVEPIAQLPRPLVSINGDFMFLTPAADAFYHDAVPAAQRDWRRHDCIGNPMDMHKSGYESVQ
ncbi:MAG: hypothetical protein ACTHLW_18335 [Verrucomicrobiota bacterium]